MTVFVEEKMSKELLTESFQHFQLNPLTVSAEFLNSFRCKSYKSFSWKLSENFSWILQEFQLKIIQEFQPNPSRVSAESFKSFSWILQEFHSAESFKSFSWILQVFQLNPSRTLVKNRVLNYIRFLHGLVIVNARGMKLKTFLSQKLLKVFFRTTFKPQVHEL